MGSFFRSEEMALCQLFLQSEAAYACVSELGELGVVQFRDLNPDVNAFQRKFVNEVRRCDEMERKLRFLEKEIKKDDIPMLNIGENPEAPQPKEMIDMEATFEKLENELREVNTNAEALKKTYLELTELKHILRKTQAFFDEMHDPSMQEESVTLLGEEGMRAGGQALKLGFVAGVLLRERLPAFERMLWRACRGNVFLRQAEIDTPLEDPITGDQVHKSVFIIFFQGEQLKSRVKKICEGFRATLYPCPETPADRREMSLGVMTRIEDLNTVLGQTQDHRHRVLVAAAKNIKSWFVKVHKIKAIYHTLNLFNLDVTHKCLIAECWCATADLDVIQLALRRGTDASGSTVPSILNRMDTKEVPPTFNRVNKFTSGFQNLVDAYGVANYREVNPALFTIITFPFLFAVMFGDAGHGLIMALFGAWMVLKEKGLANQRNPDEIFKMFFGGRYLILLMGLFSVYTGLIYNDMFSKSLNIFGSSWKPRSLNAMEKYLPTEQLDPSKNYVQVPYTFGIDPVWQISHNKITFMNSFKMKISVVFGVAQMLFGVLLGYWNHKFFRNHRNIITEFIPQLIFLLSIFGYLVLLVFAKWIKYGAEESGCAPSLLISLINMLLFKYPSEKEPCYMQDMYNGQRVLQGLLVAIAFICIPWMLFAKPYLIHKEKKQQALLQQQQGQQTMDHKQNSAVVGDQETAPVQDSHGGDEEEGSLLDILITQAIHTIEYCLGSISHTASYLRLWALSLAHAQLSEVLWTMVMRVGLQVGGWHGGIVLYFIFGLWAVLTLGVLLLMEGLSAFLHALRLHWVEFQSKFYGGNGCKFVPFSFNAILATAATMEE